MKHARHLESVDAALDAARREAAAAELPGALRARILAAARPREAPAPRGRLVDLVLRAAAVAAAIAAVVLVMPVSLEAADLDAGRLADLNARISTSVAEHLPRLDLGGDDVLGTAADAGFPLAAAAAVLVGAGLLLVRRGSRS